MADRFLVLRPSELRTFYDQHRRYMSPRECAAFDTLLSGVPDVQCAKVARYVMAYFSTPDSARIVRK